MTPTEILKKAKELISDPSHWTQGSFARNAIGESASCFGDEPVCWCARGAMIRAAAGLYGDGVYKAFQILSTSVPPEGQERAKQIGWGPDVAYNDDPKRTHAEVMAWFDQAIAAAEQT